jgi:hypothetical protein
MELLPDSSQRSAPRTGLRRVAYWSPVFICMVLFAQVSFLGLRPALCEKKRLAAAQVAMDARHTRDLALYDAVAIRLRARSDPIFLERQRRKRLHEPLLAQE